MKGKQCEVRDKVGIPNMDISLSRTSSLLK